MAQFPTATIVVHASVETGQLRASVELPSGRIQGAVGGAGAPITFITDAAVSGRRVRVRMEALSGQVTNVLYTVRVTAGGP